MFWYSVMYNSCEKWACLQKTDYRPCGGPQEFDVMSTNELSLAEALRMLAKLSESGYSINIR